MPHSLCSKVASLKRSALSGDVDRAFRRSATSPVFASLYDTPGRAGNPHKLRNEGQILVSGDGVSYATVTGNVGDRLTAKATN